MRSPIDIKKLTELVIQAYLIRGSLDITDAHDLANATVSVTPAVYEAMDAIFEHVRSDQRVAVMIYRNEDELDPIEELSFHIFRNSFKSDDELREFFEDLGDFIQGDDGEPFHGGILVVVSNIPDEIGDDDLLEVINHGSLKPTIPQIVLASLVNRG